ncbi:MAG: carboxymuconolactone decarboxylase family protein [Rhodoferax sp.]|nr:carboxymuconolactone decarboxylase family protein [Rhodoferax sp.]
MTRILPVQQNNTPPMSAPILDMVKRKIGRVPNLVRTLAHSPAALKFYLSQTEALAAGTLNIKLREQIALTVAGINSCDYCASTHTFIGRSRGIDSDELADNLMGISNDLKTQVALDFTRQILTMKGHVDDETLTALKSVGFIDAEIVEIIAHVGMNIFTNYFNHVAKAAIDFPFVSSTLTR